MECVVETVNPTRKQINVTLSTGDVDAAINAGVNSYRKDLALPGFRKGKVPASVVERRFGEEIAARATQQKVNELVDEVLKEQGIEPFSRIDFDGDSELKRGQTFTCKLSFDVLPDIAFPVYEGLAVEEAKSEVGDEVIEEVVNRLRSRMASTTPVEEVRLPEDGDVADVDFDGFDENGEPVKDVTGQHFMLTLGEQQALPDFEALVKTVKVGETGEGPVAFPSDYGHAELAGKTVTMKITVNGLQSRVLPEVDEEFAKQVGLESVEKLRESIREHEVQNRKNAAKGEAMKKLLDGLLEGVDVPLPEGLLNSRVSRILDDRSHGPDAVEPTDEERASAKEQAEKDLRPEVFLMALGKKEGLTVAEQEVDMHIYSMSLRARQDYNQVREAYYRSGLVHELRDRILADKAMEHVYSKAQITEV